MHYNYVQEFVQKRGYPIPEYVEIEKEGPDHRPTFVVEVRVNGKVLGQGIAASKKTAEKLAAKEAFIKL